MPVLKRIKTKYPGVYYVMGRSIAQIGKSERIYYIRYRKYGKEVEEKAGRQFQDQMSAEKAANIRAECIEGKRLSRRELRDLDEAERNTKKKIQRKDQADGTGDKTGFGRQSDMSTDPEETFRNFVETASDLMCMLDRDRNLTYVNGAMALILGY